ncbi:MAG TPA: hypothetical protein PKJ36_12505, partial [Flavihumibacter sp.]|nr:hypothetical protein [Flavihumibacter sp.]
MKLLYPSIKAIFSVMLMVIAGSTSAQNLSFNAYRLVNGGDGQKGAEYRFDGVVSNAFGQPVTDCIVRIENISAGVQLKNIDATGDAALQPVVEHMNTTGPSWIEFSFRFVQHQENNFQSIETTLPALAASVYGLNGFDRAQEFVEYDLGNNSQVVYETAVNNLMVSRSGNAFHAENKWGILTAGKNNVEKMSLMNQQVSTFKVKVGINRKNQTWTGTSTYNLELSNNNEALVAAYGVQNSNNVTLAGFKMDGKKETNFKGEQVEMGAS